MSFVLFALDRVLGIVDHIALFWLELRTRKFTSEIMALCDVLRETRTDNDGDEWVAAMGDAWTRSLKRRSGE